MKLTDEALRLAARQVCQAMADALPAPEDCRHQFSPAFRRKMRPLLRRRSQHSILRRVAAAVLAAFVGIGAWLLVDNDARADLLQWVKEVYEEHILYRFFGAPDPAADPTAYAPAWLPEGYVEVERYEWEDEMVIVYEGYEKKQIMFGCSTTQENRAAGIILEKSSEDLVAKTGLSGFFYCDPDGDDPSTLYWTDENLGLSFDLSSFEDLSVMLHIANSVVLTK